MAKEVRTIEQFRNLDFQQRASESKKHMENDAICKIATESKQLLPTTMVDEELLPQLTPIVLCIGDELARGIHRGALETRAGVPHLELSTYIALKSVLTLHSTRAWEAWSGMDEHIRQKELLTDEDKNFEKESVKLHWYKTMMTLALALPIGYMHSHTYARTTESELSWTPAVDNLSDYTTTPEKLLFVETKRDISPKQISQRVHHRLFDQPPNIGGLLNAEMDFWSPGPNKDNPFYKSMKRALTQALKHYELVNPINLPFWWVGLYNQMLRSDDFVPLSYYTYVDNKSSAKDDPVKTEPIDTSTSEKGPTTDADETIPERVRSLLEWVNSEINKGEILINQNKALLHQYKGQVCVVYPQFYDQCASLRADLYSDSKKLSSIMIENKLVHDEINYYEFRAQGKRRGTVNLQPLTDLGRHLVLGNRLLEDNLTVAERPKAQDRVSNLVPLKTA